MCLAWLVTHCEKIRKENVNTDRFKKLLTKIRPDTAALNSLPQVVALVPGGYMCTTAASLC